MVADGEAVGLAEGEAAGLAEGEDTGISVGLCKGIRVGHGANSQFGPVLPTVVPSGQTFASWVQAFSFVRNPLFIKKYPPAAKRASNKSPKAKIKMVFFPLLGTCGGATAGCSSVVGVGVSVGCG